jgi:predicted ATPase/DNA-binding winged helix-turn-helix (wHTH) protein
MAETRSYYFGPFHLDVVAAQLARGTEAVRLTAKAWGVLHYLVTHAHQLVTKDDLLAAVWGTPYVSDAALAVCIRELRQALGDDAQTPQYVETVRGRGYRFLAPLTPVSSSRLAVSPALPLVGREAELAQLDQAWTHTLQGTRQIVMVTGEAGIGKTSLVDAWLTQVAATDTAWLGRGQCIEQHGAGEAYLPLLEALGRLGREPEGTRLVEVLQQQAPSWLVHLSALVPPEAFAALQRRVSGTTRERMLRELAEAVEVLTVERPLVLVLEDLHWSDSATLDWLAYVARRRDRARLLVLGTYRPADAIVRGHPVHTATQELQRQGHGAELVLGYVSAAGVVTYLVQRLGAEGLPQGLAEVLYQRTHGHPLFLVAMVDALLRQGVLQHGATGWTLVGEVDALARELPENLRQLIERQVEALPREDQGLLEVASVAGVECPAASIAAGVEQALEDVEVRCAALTRRGQFLQARETTDWPDGTVTAQYGFRHALYQEVLYDRVPVSRRVRWHRQIGTRLETGYGPRAREVATELAAHFVRGRDVPRAVQYLLYAGENALQRSAYPEAITHLTQGLTLLQQLPDTPQRTRQELHMQMALGSALRATQGFGHPEVAQVYARAQALCQQIGDTPALFPVLLGLRAFYTLRGELHTARELGEQLLQVAQQAQEPDLLLNASHALGGALFWAGASAAARVHLEAGLALYDRQQLYHQAALADHAPGVSCGNYLALVLWQRGYLDQARRQSAATLALAHARTLPFSQAGACSFATQLQQCCRDVAMAHTQATATITLCQRYGFAQFLGIAQVTYGWTLAAQGQPEAGLALMQQGLVAEQAVGAEVARPYCLALLAEVYAQQGQPEAGLAALAEGLAMLRRIGAYWYEAELHRLYGTLLMQADTPQSPLVRGVPHTASPAPPAEAAEAHLYRAWHIARHQEAKSLELRAAVSLARLWQQQGKGAEAYQLLAEVYGWFTEGFDTADLQEARALLATLEG